MTSPPAIAQNPDIRFLGRLLGDVIRAFGGEALFRRIEYIRSASGRPRRAGSPDAEAIDHGLDALALDETISFVRGFMLFSMLANLAEDRQGVAAGAGCGPRVRRSTGSRPAVSRGTEAATMLNQALIVPVLTAHPTEVRRKSMIDHRNRIAALMALRDTGAEETAEGDLIEAAILRQIALLWQTRPLRRERLYVADEVDTALTYLRDVFLPVLPALYARWERVLGSRPRSFLRPGSWIGGDRDGNPNVTAASLEAALGRASEAVLADYLAQIHTLGANCRSRPRSARPATRSRPWPRQAATMRPRAATNPIAARSAASMAGWQRPTRRSSGGRRRGRRPWPRPPMRIPRRCAPIWSRWRGSLEKAGEGVLADGGGSLGRLIRAVETFGFHLATLDLRQNADVHERVVAEMLAVAGVEPDYLGLDEDARVALLRP
jgi:phosphoenolpyruvate carboxylase